MSRTLGLASPLTQGVDVKETQELLQGAGPDMPYGAFYRGALHGIYDEATADAAADAKYWLGYPLAEIDSSAGDQTESRWWYRKYRTSILKLPSARTASSLRTSST